MSSNRVIEELLQPVITEMGLELYGCELSPGPHKSMLRVYIERPTGGVTLDDCVAVSRQVGAILDVENPISGRYELEVSSPGLDRPLFQPEHFAAVIGRQIKVRLIVPKAGQRNFSGVLSAVHDATIELQLVDKKCEFKISEIATARLIPNF